MLLSLSLSVDSVAVKLDEGIQFIVPRGQENMPQAVEQPVVLGEDLWHRERYEAQDKQACRQSMQLLCQHLQV